jgi:hypothetical protein
MLRVFQESEHLKTRLSNVKPVMKFSEPDGYEMYSNVLKKRKENAYYAQ